MNRVREALDRASGKHLVACSTYCYDPAFVEIAGHMGVDILWIEMEHAHVTFAQAADLCRMAAGMGMLSMIRVPDPQRQNVLRAAECGPDILDLPMANSPELCQEFVSHARCQPQGHRGFFTSSRAARYGLFGDIAEERRRINDQLCLMIQIETVEAVGRLDELCSVPGVDAVFIGIGDLSASMGLVGQADHPEVVSTVERIIAGAKGHGKIVAGPGTPEWMARGIDIGLWGSNVSVIKAGLSVVMAQSKGDG
jgi:2-keto-3-deoxy-L-rhamnonate aldolase RhmA